MVDDSGHPPKREHPNDFESAEAEQKPRKRVVLPNPKASIRYKREQKRIAFEKLSPKDQEAYIAKGKAEKDAYLAKCKAEQELEAMRERQRSLFQELLRERPDLKIEGTHKSCKRCLRPNYSRYWCPECPCCICKGDDHVADWCPRNERPWRETSAPKRTITSVPFEEAQWHFPSSPGLQTVKESNQKRLKRFRSIRSSIVAPGNDDLAKYLTTSPVRYYPSSYSIAN
jgi:hypothetical protein